MMSDHKTVVTECLSFEEDCKKNNGRNLCCYWQENDGVCFNYDMKKLPLLLEDVERNEGCEKRGLPLKIKVFHSKLEYYMSKAMRKSTA